MPVDLPNRLDPFPRTRLPYLMPRDMGFDEINSPSSISHLSSYIWLLEGYGCRAPSRKPGFGLSDIFDIGKLQFAGMTRALSHVPRVLRLLPAVVIISSMVPMAGGKM